jgi:hypothetical protein
VSRARERARNLPALLFAVTGGEECTEDEGISGVGANGNGVDEVDEVKTGGCDRVSSSLSFEIPLSNPLLSTISLLAIFFQTYVYHPQVIPFVDACVLSATDTTAQKKTREWMKNMTTLVSL